MDAIELLTNDHNKVRELFAKFNGGGGLTGLVRRAVGSVSPQERRRAVEQVCRELEAHTRIEEEIFYPAVRALGDPELDGQVKEALSEHDKVKREVARLRETGGSGKDVDSQMSQLEQDVEHHASEEENEMFPRLEELMPEDEREDLARQMQALKRGGSSSARARSRPGSAGKTASSRARTAGQSEAAARPKGSQAKGRAPKGKRKRTAAPKRSTAARKGGNKRGSARKRAKRAVGRRKTARR
jgi:hemerythrin superfamily protein